MTEDNFKRDLSELMGKNPFASLPPRNPDRIDAVLADVRAVWEKYPDMRLGQIISNAIHKASPGLDTGEFVVELFYAEDDKLQRGLRLLLET